MSPSVVPPTVRELRQTYRALYKACLAAVRYSSPARYTARDCLRAAFRDESRTGDSRSFWSGRPSTATAPLSLLPSSSCSSLSSTPPSSIPAPAPAPTSTLTSLPLFSTSSPSPSSSNPAQFDRRRITNTLAFLNDAALHRGMAQKVVRNLLHARYWQRTEWKNRWRRKRRGVGQELGRGDGNGWDSDLTQDALRRFEETIRMLNHDLDMCLQV